MTEDRFVISINSGGRNHQFHVVDYIHHSGNRCEFEVFIEDRMVAAFQPDPQGHLQICQNPANLNEDLLHLLADEIETYHWHE